MGDVDWFSYLLHPESLHADFGPQSLGARWETPSARREAGAQVLQGLLSANNFRDYVLSAYPAIGDMPGRPGEKYAGPTPPSTPLSPAAGGADTADAEATRRIGQCARFSMSPETGLPSEQLEEVLRGSGLPELSARQDRLLGIADTLTGLVGFGVEDIEGAVHATVRFMYYLHLLESKDAGGSEPERQFQYRRWAVRAAYREEEAGLALEVESSLAMDANCRHLKAHADSLDGSDEQTRLDKYRVIYDLGRVLLAQSRFDQALEMFRECQRIDPARGRADRFGLSRRRPAPSVDEYVVACTTIVRSLSPSIEQAATPTGQFDAMSISNQQDARVVPLIESKDYTEAARLCFLSALSHMPADSGAAAGDFTWMLSIHPRLLVHCAVQPPSTAASVSRVLADAAAEWIASRGGPDMFSAGELEEMERRSAAIAMFITGDHWGASSAMAAAGAGAGASTDTGVLASGTDERRTVVEDQALAKDILSLDVSKPALAMLQLSYCYLTGLRLFEKEQYQSAHAWFARGVELASASLSAQQQQQQNQQQQPAAPLMAQNAEKDRILRAALESQLNVHMLLADLHCQIDQGASIGDLAEDIDAVMEAQVAIRFEFLERIVTASLRQGNKAVFTKLVGTIATNQKLWQQLPEIHLALLQFASLLVVIYDILQGVGIDIAREVAGGSSGIDLDALPAEALEGLRASVAEVAGLLLKIPVGGGRSADIDPRTVLGCSPRPGTKSENEVERFCRMWGDPEYLAMLGALVAEILHAGSGESVTGPLGLCALVALIIRKSPDAGAADGQRSSNERDVSPMDTDDVGGRSIVGALINNSTDQGRKNMQHMQDTALVVFKCVARAMPADACVWLYFSAVATGERLESAFMPLFVEFLGLHTDAFSPAALDKCVGQAWFQQRLPAMIRSLVALNMSGAAAVLHQCAAEVNYSAAIPLVAQAFESGEIDQAVAGFFWDPDIIEYAQYLSRLPSSPTRVEFAVPSMELLSSRTLILSAYFQWLAAVLSRK